LHLWHATLPNGEVLGGVAEVAAGKTAKVALSSQSKDPESRLLSSVSQNRLDKELVTAAKELSSAAGVDLVVFGALSKEGKGLALDAFLFAAEGGEVRRLPRAQFDPELLSAGVEFYNLAGQLAAKGAKSGEAVKVPGTVLANLGPSGLKLAEAKYGVQPGKEAAGGELESEQPKEEGARKPLGDQRRVPLKKKP
jgi:hypothetical protein